LRRLAVNAVRAGLRQTAAAKTYGMSLRAVNKWVAIDKVGGLRAVKPKRRGRRLGQGGRLRVAHAQRIRRLLVGTLPAQLTLPVSLWTRAAVASLRARE
jgi:transposase